MILPLRYSVAVAEKLSDLSTLPQLPGTLGDGVKDLSLTHAKYTPRMLREGYLYVLTDRVGIKSWTSYYITEDGYLYVFPAEFPPATKPEFSCDPSSCGIYASMLAIPKARDVQKAYLLFTPTPLTKAKLDEYKSKADEYAAQKKMQKFNPAAWLDGTTTQPHSMLPDIAEKTVAEYVLYRQNEKALTSPLGLAMKRQLFPVDSSAYAGIDTKGGTIQPGRLGALLSEMKRQKAAAFVIYDHIGITQELNNFRNDALQPIEQFLSQKDREGISNQRKLEVTQAIEDVKNGFVQNGIGLAQKKIEDMNSRQLPNINEQNAQTLRSLGRIQEAEEQERRAKRHREAREANIKKMLSGEEAEKEWNRKYAKQLDMDAIKKFREQLAALSDTCQKAAENRTDDHIQWLTADRLVDAYDTYDPNDLGSGFCFTQEHSLCTFGMFGIDKNKPKLSEWMNISKVERKNLYMRANLYNHKSLQEEASKAFTEARNLVAAAGSVAAVPSPPFLKAGKGMIDVLKKTDSAWDEWLRDKVVKNIHEGKIKAEPGNRIHNLSKFHRSAEGRLYAMISEWSQALSNKAGKMDKGIQAVVGMLLYGKLGELAEKIGFDEFMLKVPPEKLVEGYKKRDAQRNRELAERDAAKKAGRIREKISVEDPIDVLIQDEQRKVRDKVKITLEELDKGKRPETNNFRQARMGVLLMAIEGLALTVKLNGNQLTDRGKAEVTASILSLTGMAFDLVYAVAKSIREIEPYKGMASVDAAADVIRGGLKMTAGTLSAAAGGISMVLDFQSFTEERAKERKNWILISVYLSRAVVGGLSLGLGLIAAFSYCGPLLWRMAGTTLMKNSVFAFRLTTFFAASAVSAEAVALMRTLWLIRVARFNLIGVAVTVGEVIYRCCIMDDDLENWCQACCFRKDKSKGWLSEKPYPDVQTELKALEKAYKAITA